MWRIDSVFSFHSSPIGINKFIESMRCKNESICKTRFIYQQGRKLRDPVHCVTAYKLTLCSEFFTFWKSSMPSSFSQKIFLWSEMRKKRYWNKSSIIWILNFILFFYILPFLMIIWLFVKVTVPQLYLFYPL
jgi:hypothetical protein